MSEFYEKGKRKLLIEIIAGRNSEVTSKTVIKQDTLKLIEYETYSLFTKCQKYLDKDFYFFSQRAIKIFNGRYWLAHQYSIPVIIDKDNRLLSYLSDVFIVKKYEGEPYQSTVGLRLKAKNRGNRTKAKFLKQLFKDIKMEELVYFESKEENRLALPYIFSGRLSDAEIEEKCN